MAIPPPISTWSTLNDHLATYVGVRSKRRSIAARRIVIVASAFNQSITRALVRGATTVLHQSGISDRQIRLLWVSGAFELPVVAAHVASSRPRPDAIIALGALIRGDTPQYEVIAHAVAEGLMRLSIESLIPVTFGIIVAKTFAQAKSRAGQPRPYRSHEKQEHAPVPYRSGRKVRAGGFEGNRGSEAAIAALAVLQLFERAGI